MSGYPGVLITAEGLDGSGKTTAFDNAFEYFSKKYPNMLVRFRDPGSIKNLEDICEEIREMLLYHRKENSNWTEFYLFVASRAQLVDKYLVPNLKEGKIVFLDRFYDSTIAFQGFGNGIPIDTILYDNGNVLQGTEPDLTLLYDLPVDIALKRMAEDKNKKLTDFDKGTKDFHQRVWEGYQYVADKYQDRVKIIDATKSVEEVSKETIKIIEEFLENYFKAH